MKKQSDIHTIFEQRNSGIIYEIRRILLIVTGALILGFNLNTFVPSANMIPGGFTGFVRLIQMLFLQYKNIEIPFSPIYYFLNAIAAAVSFKYIGKKFTLYSLLMIFLSGLLVDFLPYYHITNDVLLCAVFGGILNSLAITMCLLAGATSGGTDFISILISEKYGKDAWHYIFICNIITLIISGFLLSWDSALYSIIFQFTSTQLLAHMYKRYQKITLFIITNKAKEVYKTIRDVTNHDATVFTGEGCYKEERRDMLYSIVGADDLHKLLPEIKKTDPTAFINFIRSKQILGRFYRKPND